MNMANATVNVAFSGSIPPTYDAHLGPLLFEPYALHTAQRVAELAPASVLELACGTGRLTRHLHEQLREGTRIVATDVNPAMLRFAQRLLGDRAIEWGTVDAVELPYVDNSFDVVVVQFGVMFYSDRNKAYREALRVLRPGGTLLFTCWHRLDRNPVAEITQQVIKAFFPLDTPAFYTVPFSYHDRELIREDVLTAGFERFHIELVALEGRSASAVSAARGLLEGSPIHTSILDREPFALPPMREKLTERLTERFGGRELHAPLTAWLVEARKR